MSLSQSAIILISGAWPSSTHGTRRKRQRRQNKSFCHATTNESGTLRLYWQTLRSYAYGSWVCMCIFLGCDVLCLYWDGGNLISAFDDEYNLTDNGSYGWKDFYLQFCFMKRNHLPVTLIFLHCLEGLPMAFKVDTPTCHGPHCLGKLVARMRIAPSVPMAIRRCMVDHGLKLGCTFDQKEFIQ